MHAFPASVQSTPPGHPHRPCGRRVNFGSATTDGAVVGTDATALREMLLSPNARKPNIAPGSASRRPSRLPLSHNVALFKGAVVSVERVVSLPPQLHVPARRIAENGTLPRPARERTSCRGRCHFAVAQQIRRYRRASCYCYDTSEITLSTAAQSSESWPGILREFLEPLRRRARSA